MDFKSLNGYMVKDETARQRIEDLQLQKASLSDIEGLQQQIENIERLQQQIENIVFHYDGAGYHNAIYRGAYLGNQVTEEQYQVIADGTFKDLFIGDYWTINNVNYRIACFDYYLGTGDSGKTCETHHVTLVPDTSFYTCKMINGNTNSSTSVGFTGTNLYQTGMTEAKNIINSAFGSEHVLTHNIILKNGANSNGQPTGEAWYDETVLIMTEQNVTGSILQSHVGHVDGLVLREVDNTQYPLFVLNPRMRMADVHCWLRNIASKDCFSVMSWTGAVAPFGTAYECGVRPSFNIKG